MFRNDLMELIQYSPTTKTVHEVPLLLSPPWINKYYVMDLAPGRSFAEWAVDHGHTTFAISWRNPDCRRSSMAGVGLDDYLLRGLGTAVDVVREICGVPQVNVAGLCVGGTLAVMLLAWQAQTEAATAETGAAPPVRSLTLLNTLVDFSQPGALAAFTDADAVDRLERSMAAQGLPGRARRWPARSTPSAPTTSIWNYVAGNWLMGQTPPAFDILAWNADSTRIPAATHSAYLRSFYLENRLARGADVDRWTAAAASTTSSPTSTSWPPARTTSPRGSRRTPPSGCSPAPSASCSARPATSPASSTRPGPKRVHWTNDDLPLDPDEWRAGATEDPGTWWERLGRVDRAPAPATDVPRPPPGSATHPALADAPGTYVGG